MKIIKWFLCIVLVAAWQQAFPVEREVCVQNPSDGVSLCGNLSLPDSERPRALVIFASGSGCQDRDETIGSKRPFKTLADSLVARGFASMRFDDRGAGGSGGEFAKANYKTFVEDMKCLLGLADSLFSDIPTGILGHSEGGVTAVKTSDDNRCDFIITLAMPAWQGDSIVMSQAAALSRAMTGHWENDSLQRSMLDICMQDLPLSILRMQLYSALSKAYGSMATREDVQKHMAATVEAMTSKHYREMLRYDPADDIRAVCKPWLALNGSVDLQVLPENLSRIAELNPVAETHILEGHNHLFQAGSTGLVNEYQTLSGDVSAACIELIADWLDRMVNIPGGCSGVRQCTPRGDRRQ